jgi:hypothetical protein
LAKENYLWSHYRSTFSLKAILSFTLLILSEALEIIRISIQSQ